ESRPDTRRGRKCGDRRPRRLACRSVSRRRARRERRRTRSALRGERRTARHAAERDHDPRRAQPRGARCDRLDVRSVARLRLDQRGLSDVSARKPTGPEQTKDRGTNGSELVARAEALVARLERAFAPEAPPVDWNASIAFRWRKKNGVASVEPVRHVHRIQLDDLKGIDDQKTLVEQN